MKQKKQLMIQLALLAASAVLYAGTGLIRQGAAADTVPAEDKAEAQKVLPFDAGEIRSIRWSNGTDEFQAEKDGGTWVLTNHPEFPLQVSRLEDIADAIGSLKAERTLPAEELSRYGLDVPQRSVTVETEAGEEYVIDLGSRATVDDAWYLIRKGEDAVYLVSTTLPSMLDADILKFVRNESMPAILSPDRMEIQKENGKTVILTKPEHPERYSYTDYYTWFLEEEDGMFRPVDRGLAEDLVSKVLHVKWKACVDYDLADDPEEAETYGLCIPAVTARVEGDGTSASLAVGKDAGDGLYYAQPEDSNMAYTVTAEDARALLEASYNTLRPEDICRMNWGLVTKMTLEAGDTVRDIEIERNPDQSSERKYIFRENGAELEYTRVIDIKDMIDKMLPAGQLEDPDYKVSGDPVLRVVFYQDRPGFEQMELEFYPYSKMYDLVRFNGETRQLISTHASEAVIRLMERLDMPVE